MRLDKIVAEKYSLTRNKAHSFIQDGLVSVNGKVVVKSAFDIIGSESIELREAKKIHWVSRSAGKLDGFLEETRDKIRIQGSHCLDVGSSTGGFTQVLLDRGALHVDAVDVGTDQLHPILKSDARVSSFEQTDIRSFKSTQSYDIIVCDASFISLNEILPSILTFAHEETKIILLWKPQFEVGKTNLRKTGVPKDKKIVEEKQKEWEEYLGKCGCEIISRSPSSVIGEAGNEEWLYLLSKRNSREIVKNI